LPIRAGTRGFDGSLRAALRALKKRAALPFGKTARASSSALAIHAASRPSMRMRSSWLQRMTEPGESKNELHFGGGRKRAHRAAPAPPLIRLAVDPLLTDQILHRNPRDTPARIPSGGHDRSRRK
jgi:hypothetical protein